MKVLAALLALLIPIGSEAAVADFLGQPVAEVLVRANGAPLHDPALEEIIETRAGAPLSMLEVRESIAHLFGLGLYRDVQVDAVRRGDSVVLTYNLVPAVRVRRIAFEGVPGLSENELRRVITERHGAFPSAARITQTIETLRSVFRDRGYPAAAITARLDPGRDGIDSVLVFTIQAGARARIGTIDVQGVASGQAAAILKAIDLRPGSEYDGVELDERLAEYATDLRAQGFYEVRAVQLPRYAGDGTVNIVLSIDQGPRVEIIFEGDALERADRERLVPIARERSVDEDLLEDSKFGIERHFRERGYCNPRADYRSAEADGVLRVTFAITHGPRCVVESVDVGGNETLTSAELAPLVLTRGGEVFSESTLSSDALRIQGYYRQRGFSAVKVTTQVERREPKAGSEFVRARLVIAEGVRSVLETVTFQGNTAVDADALRQAPGFSSAPGQPYFEPQIAADADSLALFYLNRGYPEVTVEPAPKAIGDGSRVELIFTIREGRQVLIDHVLIVGNDRTARETILREVQLKSGQPLSQHDENETRSRLTALGLFRRVDISYLQLPGDATHRDVIITVDEAPVTTIGYGGGLEGGKRLVRSSEGGDAVEEFQVAPRGFFQVTRRNLFGKDRSITLTTRVSFRPPTTDDGEYGFSDYLARVTYGERRIFGSETDVLVSGGVEQGVRSSFDFNRRGASATITRRVRQNMVLSGGYGLDHTRLLNIKANFAAQPEIDRLFPQVRLSSVSGSFIRDTRQDPIDPTGGTLIGSDTELAARSLGSQVGFLKTFLQGFVYRRLPGAGSTILVLGARTGLATGFPRRVIRDGVEIVVDDIPASERFYAGGDTTVRGFALDRLGTPETIDQDGFPRGGHGVIILNAEVRVPVRGGLGAVAFIDGGNVFRTVEDIDFSELRGAVGFGVRYRSPVGPIRVDLGIKLDRRTLPTGQRERPTALHISLGQAF